MTLPDIVHHEPMNGDEARKVIARINYRILNYATNGLLVIGLKDLELDLETLLADVRQRLANEGA